MKLTDDRPKIIAYLSMVFQVLFAISLCFFLVRFLSGRFIGDAARLLAFACLVNFLLQSNNRNSLFQRTVAVCTAVGEKFLLLRARVIFCLALVYFVFTHAVNGLAIHSWQGFDIAFFVQAAYNSFSEKGLMFKNIDGDFSFFGHHFSPFLFLLSGLGKLREAPFFLYIVQDISNALFAALVFREVKLQNLVSVNVKIVLLLLFATFPFWTGLIHYEFHELSFAPPLVFLACTAFKKNKPIVLFLCALGLCLIKETAFFSVLFSGMLLILFSKRRSMKFAGCGFLLVAITGFYVYFHVILPKVLSQSESMFGGYFSHIGSSKLDIILSPILQPAKFLGALLTLDNLKYVALFFGCSLPLMGRSFIWLLPVLPDFAIVLLAKGSNIKHFGNQYAGIVIGIFFFALIECAKKSSKWSEKRLKLSLGWITVCSIASINLNPIKVWHEFWFAKHVGWSTRPFVNVLRDIPKNVPVVVLDSELLPFVGQRDNLIFLRLELQRTATLNAIEVGKYVAFLNSERTPDLKYCKDVAIFSQGKICQIIAPH